MAQMKKLLAIALITLLTGDLKAQQAAKQQHGSTTTALQDSNEVEVITEPGKPSLVIILRKPAQSEPNLITAPCVGSIGACQETSPRGAAQMSSVQTQASHPNLAQVIANQEKNVNQLQQMMNASIRENLEMVTRLLADGAKAALPPSIQAAAELAEAKNAYSEGRVHEAVTHMLTAVLNAGEVPTGAVDLTADAIEAKINLNLAARQIDNWQKAKQSLDRLRALAATGEQSNKIVIVDGMYYSDDGGQTWKLKTDRTNYSFDPATLTAEEYEGWLRNQAKVHDETLGSSDVNQRLQELRREAARADEDLRTAEAELTREQSLVAAGSGQAGSSPSGWRSPQNYVCRSGPCTLTEWQIENSGNPQNQPSPAQSSGKFYSCSTGPCTLSEWMSGQQPARQSSQAQQPVATPAPQNSDNANPPAGNCGLYQNCRQSTPSGLGTQTNPNPPAQPKPGSPTPASGPAANVPPKTPAPPVATPPPPPSDTCSKEGICCPWGMVPNPQAIACLHAPPIVNGRPNVCWRDQNGRYIPFCIAGRK